MVSAEEEWQDWWRTLAPETRESVDRYEDEIGSALSWNQIYLIVRAHDQGTLNP